MHFINLWNINMRGLKVQVLSHYIVLTQTHSNVTFVSIIVALHMLFVAFVILNHYAFIIIEVIISLIIRKHAG